MFTWINNQGVQSNAGFTLQSADRYGYHYSEGNKTMRINVEPMRTESGGYYEEVLTGSMLKWLPPNDSDRLPDQEIARIRKNVADALSFMKIGHRFV